MSVTEGMDEFEQTVSRGSKRSRSRTSEVWNDSKYYLYMKMAIEKLSVENVLIF